MSPGIRVLCVDDDPDVRSLTATALERTSDELDVATASGSREALDRVANGKSQTPEDAVEHGSTNSRLQAHEGDSKRDKCDVTVTVGRLEDGSASGFYVADDGVGLETATDELFEFGHTTADDGTGLGLAIVDGIAEAHGWTVSACESDRGGARFDIRGVTLLEEPAVEQ